MTAYEVRLLDEDGKQIGIVKTGEALQKAKERGSDLIEIAANANPPVARILDFTKFKYLQEKKEKEAKKHAKATELKEVRFTPFIGEHDLQVGLDRAKKFLEDGNLVKVSIRFKGAQMAHQEFGPKLLTRILEALEGMAQEERQAKFEGRQFVTILKPAKIVQKKETDTKEEAKNENQN